MQNASWVAAWNYEYTSDTANFDRLHGPLALLYNTPYIRSYINDLHPRLLRIYKNTIYIYSLTYNMIKFGGVSGDSKSEQNLVALDIAWGVFYVHVYRCIVCIGFGWGRRRRRDHVVWVMSARGSHNKCIYIVYIKYWYILNNIIHFYIKTNEGYHSMFKY